MEFLRLWKEACGKATKHLYPHMLACHLPQLIRDLPIDPMYLSLQSQEHRHSQRKKAEQTKKAPKPKEDRLETVTSHSRRGLTHYVQTYQRNGGPGRTLQTLRIMALQDELEDIYETPQSQAIRHQRWLAQKIRRKQTLCHQKIEQMYQASKDVQTKSTAEGEDLALEREVANDLSDSEGEESEVSVEDEDDEDSPSATDEDDF